MMSPSDEKRIVAMVDSFTKTVARNFSRNLKRAKANREKHFSDEPIDYLLELLSHDDGYPSDHFVLYADELSLQLPRTAHKSCSPQYYFLFMLFVWGYCLHTLVFARLRKWICKQSAGRRQKKKSRRAAALFPCLITLRRL